MVCPFLDTCICQINYSKHKEFILLVLLQAHPFFNGIEWDKLYLMEAAFIPEVKDELDTQNFEKFEEVLICFFFLLSL